MATDGDSRKGRRRRWPLWLSLALAPVVLVVLLLGAVIAGANTHWGRQALTGWLEAAVSRPGEVTLTLGRIEGTFPQRLTLDSLSLADAEGPWLEVRRATLEWRPLALLSGRLSVARIEAETVELSRLPEAAAEAETSAPAGLPRGLPFAFAVERLRIGEIRLSQALLGEAARLSLDASANAKTGNAVTSRLTVARLDKPGTTLRAEAAYDLAAQALNLNVTAQEPAGGLAARLLDLPGLPAVEVTMQGEGPLEAWRGRLEAAAGGGRLDSDLKLTRQDGGLAFGADGSFAPGDLVEGPLQGLLGPETAFSLAGRLGDDGGLTLDEAVAEAPAGRAVLSGRLQADGETFEAAGNLTLADGAALAPLIAPAAVGGGEIGLQASGTLARPRISLDARLSDVETPDADATSLTIAATLTPDRPLHEAAAVLAYEASVQAAGFMPSDADLAGILDPDLTLRSDGRLEMARDLLLIDGLSLESGPFGASGSGSFDLSATQGELALSYRHGVLSRLSGLSGLELQGALTGDAYLTITGQGITGPVAGEVAGPRLGIAEADSLIGERLDFAGTLSVPFAGGLVIEDLTLAGEAMQVAGGLTLNETFRTLDVSYRAQAPDIKKLSDSLGMPVAGAVVASGRLFGPVGNPSLDGTVTSDTLTLDGRPIEKIRLQATAAQLARGAKGEVAFSLVPAPGAVEGRLTFALEERTRLALRQIEVRRGAADEVKGEVTLPLAGGPLSGKFEGAARDLSAWSSLAGVPLAGTLSGRVALRADAAGGQAVTLEGQGRDLALAGGTPVRLDRLSFSAEVEDALGAPRGRARVELAAATFPGGTIERAELRAGLRATGQPETLRLDLTGEGQLQAPLKLSATATLALKGEGIGGRLEALKADYGEAQIGLERPAVFAYAPPDVRLEDLALSLDGGRLTAAATMTRQTVQAELTAEAVPLSLLTLLAPKVDLAGRLDANLRLDGPVAAPNGELRVDLADLRLQGGDSGLPALSSRLDGRLRAGRFSFQGTASGFAERPLTLSGDIPLALSAAPVSLVFDEGAPAEARLDWSGDLDALVKRLPVDSLTLSGKTEIDLALSGSLGAPRIGGRFQVEDGRYENFTSGTILRPLSVLATARGERLTLERFEAGDGNGGKLALAGTVSLADGEPEADLRLTLDKATLVRRDEVTASLSGQARFQGGPQQASVTGRIESERIEARLIDALPREVVSLDVTEINVPGQSAAPVAAPPSGSDWLTLDLQAVLPGRVFIRGRGLDSEWAGEFTVKGSAAKPVIDGRLRPVRGNFSFAGKAFQLQEGSITFVGGEDVDPLLDLSAIHKNNEIEAIVRVRGRASDPEITLESIPALPQDEVLSRVLFGKSASRLSALEAVQLAQAAASLSGGGGAGGILDVARQTLGVDVLEFSGGEEGSLGSVAVGKYLTDDIYVGVEQGATPGSTEVTVEYEVTPNITVESDVGATSGSRVGVRWEWDY